MILQQLRGVFPALDEAVGAGLTSAETALQKGIFAWTDWPVDRKISPVIRLAG
jgi:hypothetical protein